MTCIKNEKNLFTWRSYNFVIKLPPPIVVMLGNSSTKDYHLFPVLKQNLGRHRFEESYEIRTVATRLLILVTQNTGNFNRK
jgi:hypothetical protein